MKFEVVILGGGFAGAYCARALARELGGACEQRVALISQENVLTFQPMLPEVAGSSLAPVDVVNPLRYFCRGVNVLRGTVRAVDWEKKIVCLDAGRFTPNHEIGFEHIVLALGSVVDFNQVPGLSPHGLPMKTVAHALRLRAAVINRLEEANLADDPAARRRLLTFVVVGGGYTGVETAGQLLDFLEGVQPRYGNLRGEKLRVILVHSRDHLLPEIGPALGTYAQRVLERRGTEVLLNSRIIEVDADEAILDNGGRIETHTVISTVGNTAHPAVVDLCHQLGLTLVKGRVPAEPTMRVSSQTNLWAAGDCAAIPWEKEMSPPTAQFALRQGEQLGRNIARALRGEPLQPFKHSNLGQLATVGRHAAVAEILGVRFSGFFAWWIWRTIYLAKLPGLSRKLRVMMDWTLELFFPPDVSLFIPPPEEPLQPMHFRNGEPLFTPQTPAHGILAVQRGSITVSQPGNPARALGPGEMLGPELQDERGRWNCNATAAEPTDILLLRGAALTFFAHTPRKPAPAGN